MITLALVAALVIATQDALPPFTAADELAAARALVGAVERGSAGRSAGPGTIARVAGFQTTEQSTLYVVLLSTTYAEHGLAKHVFVLGGHYVEDGLIDDHQAQTTEVNAAVLEFQKGAWVMTVRSPALADTGFNGNDPDVVLQRVGVNRHVIQVTEGAWSQGSSITTVTLYEPVPAGFTPLVAVNVAADDCGWKDPCFRYEGSLVYDWKSNLEAFDLSLRLEGTYRNAAGRIGKMPAAAIVLRSQAGTYAPIDRRAPVRAIWTFVTRSPW